MFNRLKMPTRAERNDPMPRETKATAATHFAREFELDAQPGLPELLPDDERILWQGAPDAWGMARSAFHVVHVACYFAVLMAWGLASKLHDGVAFADAVTSLVPFAGVAALALAMLALMGFWAARTSVYTLTTKRVVMRVGIVLTVAYNLPLTRIRSADLRRMSTGRHDVVLHLEQGTRIAWLHLWPHVLPWQVAAPRPMLRALPDAAKVAALLGQAWAKANQHGVVEGASIESFVNAPKPAEGGLVTDRPLAA
jgi:hypothetical protein